MLLITFSNAQPMLKTDKLRSLVVRSPAGFPRALRDRLNTRVSPPSEFRARVEQDMARWRPLAHVVNQS